MVNLKTKQKIVVNPMNRIQRWFLNKNQIRSLIGKYLTKVGAIMVKTNEFV